MDDYDVHITVERNQLKRLEELLKKKYNPDIKKYGKTPLHTDNHTVGEAFINPANVSGTLHYTPAATDVAPKTREKNCSVM